MVGTLTVGVGVVLVVVGGELVVGVVEGVGEVRVPGVGVVVVGGVVIGVGGELVVAGLGVLDRVVVGPLVVGLSVVGFGLVPVMVDVVPVVFVGDPGSWASR